ncbi:MAG: hypothetical protein EOP48_29720 [Sphingobacteriales bacterium]|nr:MAG: hypothetical protein EOP48_29720 [Sphingobacteriales bacterium]
MEAQEIDLLNTNKGYDVYYDGGDESIYNKRFGKDKLILNEKMKDGTWYAFSDFHSSIIEKRKPMLDVSHGAHAAIVVHLANESLYSHTVQKWKDEYNV